MFLSSSDVKVVNSEVIETEFSDHLPVLVEVGV